MFRPAIAVVAALMASVPATAATGPDENRQRAALVEWTVANCPPEGVPAMMVAMASMIANGSTPEQMADARTWVRGKISENYADTPAACAAIIAGWKQP